MEAVDIPYEIYKATVDANISAAYCCDPSEVRPDETRPEDWLIVEDPIMSQISIIDAKYDTDIIKAALNERLQASGYDKSIM